MLIEFKVKNFLSYRDESIFRMTRVKSYKEHYNTHIMRTNRGLELLKTAAIYGSNGGGKSNFARAIGFLCSKVHKSFGDSLLKDEQRSAKDFYFKLNNKTEKAPSMFEITFVSHDVIYRYGFEIRGHEIISEWLFKKNEVETMLFSRIGKDFDINKTGFPEGLKYKDEVNANVLFLSHLAQHNAPEGRKVYDWFLNTNVVSGLVDGHYSNVSSELLREKPEFRTWLSLATRFLGISKIEAAENEDKITTYHNKYDDSNVIVDSVAFDLRRDESHGTRKIIYLLGAVYDSLIAGGTLIIDELDSKLHPNLTRKLLEFFHKHNRRGAQLVFTAHDASLLDKELLRRDQIWFVDRDRLGGSEIYPMSDFDSSVVRSTSDFRRKYLDSTFGAAESVEITDELIDLMYE